jgi:hypothetical protein
MQKIVIQATVQPRRRRAVELFSREANFRPKVVANKRAYTRKTKHRNGDR